MTNQRRAKELIVDLDYKDRKSVAVKSSQEKSARQRGCHD